MRWAYEDVEPGSLSAYRQGRAAQETGGVDQADRHRDELPPPAQNHSQGSQESKVSLKNFGIFKLFL